MCLLAFLCFNLCSLPGLAQTDISLNSKNISFELDVVALKDALVCPLCQVLEHKALSQLKLENETLFKSLQVRQAPGLSHFNLEARYSYRDKNDKDNKEHVTPWLELSQLSQQVLPIGVRTNKVWAEYRLRISGFEQSGLHTVDLIYSLGGASVRQSISILVAPMVVFRLDDDLKTEQADIYFDFRTIHIRDFLNAIETGKPAQITNAEFKQLWVYSNQANGILVKAEIQINDAKASYVGKQLLLFGQPISKTQMVLKDFQDGFVKVLSRDDLALKLTGAEPWGSYQVILQFRAELLP